MKIIKSAIAGTLESCDIQFTIQPFDSGIKLELDSPVLHLYEKEINDVISRTLEKYKVEHVYIRAVDKGALNCTIAARLECALIRASESKSLNWEAK